MEYSHYDHWCNELRVKKVKVFTLPLLFRVDSDGDGLSGRCRNAQTRMHNRDGWDDPLPLQTLCIYFRSPCQTRPNNQCFLLIRLDGVSRADTPPSRLGQTEGKQNPYFYAFSPQYFSDDFPELVRAFLGGPLSLTDFSDGLLMDW